MLAGAHTTLELHRVAQQRAIDHAHILAIGQQHGLCQGQRRRLEQALQRRQGLAQPVAADVERHPRPQQLVSTWSPRVKRSPPSSSIRHSVRDASSVRREGSARGAARALWSGGADMRAIGQHRARHHAGILGRPGGAGATESRCKEVSASAIESPDRARPMRPPESAANEERQAWTRSG
jgi:hypothetical protein